MRDCAEGAADAASRVTTIRQRVGGKTARDGKPSGRVPFDIIHFPRADATHLLAR
jgi:hypothetical protein